jgi:hypothetical protein
MWRIDPFYWYLRASHRTLFSAVLKPEELSFVKLNLVKHRRVQWINLISSVLIFFGLRDVPTEQIGAVITALLAPVMVMGAAWFAVSFGAIPARLIKTSMVVTFWMYVAFKVSLSTMFIAIGFVTPPAIWPVLSLIYLAVDFSCAQYDTADGLKAGLDEAVLNHSRAALLYYQQQGITLDNNE